jgi:flagellar biosynthesis/type III secretory pathway M-ring protein FliF/YscJ
LINSQVRRDSVSKLPIEYISIINQAQNLADLVDLEEMWMKKKIKCEQRVEMNDTKGIENIKSLFK